MRVLVAIGRVLDPSGIVVKRQVGRIFVNREEYLIQPADRCALEAALRIKDAVDAEVVALPRCLLPDDDVLRLAVATGADRAIHLTGGGATAADDAVMARALAAAVERLGSADLVLTGATTLDTGQGQFGPRLAEALGWPQILNALHVEAASGRAEVILREGNRYVTVEASLPAVVTVLPNTLKPRYPDGVRLINVYEGAGGMAAAVEQWDVADLVGEESLKPLWEQRGRDFPPEREHGVRVSGTLEEMAQAAADALNMRVLRQRVRS